MLRSVLGGMGTLRHRCEGVVVSGLVAVAAFLAVSLAAGCSPNAVTSVPIASGGSTGVGVTGSGKLVTKEISVSDFSQLEVGSAFKVDITRSDNFSVAVTADDNVIDMVDVVKSDQTLRIGLKPGSYNNVTYRASIGMPDLRRLQVFGASTCTLSGFRPHTLDLGLLGASQLTGRLEGGQISLAAQEASTVTLGGSADSVVLTASGASHANLGDLSANTARASLKEASTCTINIKERLDADLRSASNLYYIGNPSLGSVSAVEGSSLRHR